MAVFTVKDSRMSPYFEPEVDETVKRAQAMLPELLLGASLASLADTFPAEVEAIRLRVAPESRQRWELEARILAQQPPAEIALGMNMNPKVVGLFEAWFYDVRDRLEIGSFFESDLIDRSRITDEVLVEIVWKAVAYSGGADAFGELLRRYERNEALDSGVPVWLRSETGDEWAIGRWLFTTLMPNLALPAMVMDNLNAFYMRSLPAERTREVDLDRVQAAANEGMVGVFAGCGGAHPAQWRKCNTLTLSSAPDDCRSGSGDYLHLRGGIENGMGRTSRRASVLHPQPPRRGVRRSRVLRRRPRR